jgi:hypothetical protein
VVCRGGVRRDVLDQMLFLWWASAKVGERQALYADLEA